MVPKFLMDIPLQHFPVWSMLQLTDFARTQVHPRWVWLCLFYMASSVKEFTRKVSLVLLLGSIHDHFRWNSFIYKQTVKGKGNVTFICHGYVTGPTTGCRKHLHKFVASLGRGTSKQCVSKHVVGQSDITQHAVIGKESPHDGGICHMLQTYRDSLPSWEYIARRRLKI